LKRVKIQVRNLEEREPVACRKFVRLLAKARQKNGRGKVAVFQRRAPGEDEWDNGKSTLGEKGVQKSKEGEIVFA